MIKDVAQKSTDYRHLINKRLSTIIPVLQKVALGDFTQRIEVPEKEDEFTELLVALNMTIENLQNAEEKKKKAEEKLQESEELHKALVEATGQAGIGLVILQNTKDREGAIVSVNEQACRISGYSQEEALKMSIQDTIPPDIFGPIISKYRARQQGRFVPSFYEAAIIRKDKTRLPIMLSLATTKLHGKPATVVYLRDITEIKQAEEEIKRNARELALEKAKLEEIKIKDEAILASIGEGLFVVDLEGKLILVNRAFEDLLGWKKEEALGKSFMNLIPAEDDEGNRFPSNKRPIMVALATGKPITKFISGPSYYLIRKDKTRLPIAYKVTLMVLGGKIIGAIGIFRDITHEKEVDRMKTEFLSIAAHQLRTPLGSMRWNLEMLLSGDMGKVTNQVTETLRQIYAGNQRMIDLVDDLLNVSRIEQGKVPNIPEPTDILAIIKCTMADLESEIKKRQLDINLIAKENIPKINLDTKRFRQVIDNLLSNSVKYNNLKGKVIITVGLQNNKILLSVANTGKSIAQKDQAGIFSKFFRSVEAMKSETSGSGLGLYVVKSYVEDWGGKVWFKSPLPNKNNGSIFYVELPLKPKN